MADVYVPAARSAPGCCGMADGSAVYAQCLKFHTTTTLSADDVHAIGLEQVARIERRFQDACSVFFEVDYEGETTHEMRIVLVRRAARRELA